ncbi:MAG: SAF domain-containing protein [Clostridiales Family XIII bacterium]|jgi:hypothetical protein|nr:SAF domain-containing protein [Clostridiales Family XIII bacterium]
MKSFWVRYRHFSGIIFILIGMALLICWEVYGRETILMEDVVVTIRHVGVGEKIEESMLDVISVPKNALVEKPVKASEINSIIGHIVASDIYKNAQISKKTLTTEKELSHKKESYFVIKKEWIYMRSSALRKGDYIDIVTKDEANDFGRFKIAFVKNIDDEEVYEKGQDGFAAVVKNKDERIDASSQIDHIEIACTQNEYMRIAAAASIDSNASLILIQRERIIDGIRDGASKGASEGATENE